MTTLPPLGDRKLGLVIDLDICVGCHACAVSCKAWNTLPHSAPLPDQAPNDNDTANAWANRIHTYEIDRGQETLTVHFPKSCLHCEDAPCVRACPTGASYKREEDGIVLIDADRCIGCGLCAWSCPYGALEMDAAEGVMTKCTLCVDRIYNLALQPEDREPACVRTCPASARHFGDLNDPGSHVSRLVAERGGPDLMPEMGTKPVNKYLPPRRRRGLHKTENVFVDETGLFADADYLNARGGGIESFFAWVDRTLDRLGGDTVQR